jgi:single-strand DNA-binding protein
MMMATVVYTSRRKIKMSDLNSISITGRLTKDAEQKQLTTGTILTTCNIAHNIGFGENTKVIYFKVSLWGKVGVNVLRFLTKGTLLGITGTFELNEWESNDGVKHTQCVINTNAITLLSSPKKEETYPLENIHF